MKQKRNISKWRRAAALALSVAIAATFLPVLPVDAVNKASTGLTVPDFNMTANPNTFVEDGDVQYTVSFTMPADLTGYDAVKIAFSPQPPNVMTFIPASATVKVNGVAAPGVTIQGMLTPPYIELNDAVFAPSSFSASGGAEIELTLTNVRIQSWITGKPIKNEARLFFKENGGDYLDWIDYDAITTETVYPPLWHPEPVHVTYSDDDATGGVPPVDSNAYNAGEVVTVLGNAGIPPLTRTGYVLVGWSREIAKILLVSEYEKGVAAAWTITGTGEPGYVIKLIFFDTQGNQREETPSGYDLTGITVTVGADGRWEYVIPTEFGNEIAGWRVDEGGYQEPFEETIKYLFSEGTHTFAIAPQDVTLTPIWAPGGAPPEPILDTDKGDSVVYLLIKNAGEGGADNYKVTYYETADPTTAVKLDIPISGTGGLTYFDATISYYLFEGLTNDVEYTFEVQAEITATGAISDVESTTGTPKYMGDPGGYNTDLVSIQGVAITPPVGGWPETDGNTLTNPIEEMITLPRDIDNIIIHRNYIEVADSASFVMYSDLGFTNVVESVSTINGITLLNEVYISLEVTSANTLATKFYLITVKIV